MLLELIKAAALLLALSMLQGFIVRFTRQNKLAGQVLSGSLFGGICVVGMMLPIEVTPGVIFDPRSVILSMAGLFGGPIVSGIAAVIAGGYRLWLGGGGVYVGVAVVVASAGLGLAYRYAWQQGKARINIPWLLVFGLLVHIVEILLFTQLPADVVDKVMATVAIPLIVTFTPATAFLGALLADIENRFKTELALKESEAKLSLHLQNTPLAAISWDANLCCMQWNKAAEKIFGYSENEAIGKHATDLIVTEEITDEIKALYRSLMTRQGGFRNTNENKTKDGRIITCDWYNTLIVDEDGKAVGISSLCEDITEKVEAAEALRRSQKMDAVGQLTGGIAHDFNNILGIILGNLELLKYQVSGNEPVLKRIDTIEIAALRAANLTSQLLGFSRKQATDLVVTNINDEISVMDSLMARTVTPEVEVDLQLSATPWSTEINRGDFQDALLNLILNARDAMPGGGRLTIETRNCALDETFCSQHPGASTGDYVLISISDTGKGLTPEQREKIFEPFYTTKPVGEGTGLGLSMVFGFVTRSGGYIDVESKPGRGATFHLYLPRASEQSTTDGKVDKQADARPGGTETILAVDDESELLHLAGDSLESLGYRVLTATNGKDAIALLDRNPDTSLLFSDVIMPGGMNGFELAEAAREKHPTLRVLLTSGHAGKTTDRGGSDRNILMKPYSTVDLARRVRSLLDD